MIKQFKHKGLERFFTKGTKAKIQPKHAERLRLILGRLNASTCPKDMSLPGLNLHELSGNRKGIIRCQPKNSIQHLERLYPY